MGHSRAFDDSVSFVCFQMFATAFAFRSVPITYLAFGKRAPFRSLISKTSIRGFGRTFPRRLSNSRSFALSVLCLAEQAHPLRSQRRGVFGRVTQNNNKQTTDNKLIKQG